MSTNQKTEEREEYGQVDIPVLQVDEAQTVEERFTDNAIKNILPARYLDKNSNGQVTEEPHELFERVADNIATAEFEFAAPEEAEEAFEEWKQSFEQAMKEQRFMPNSPTLMNAGLELQQLSACFVVEPKDDMGHILDTVKDAGLIFKSGGGVGYAFHHLRPKGALVESTKGKSSGPLSFMRLYDETCNQVKQGGKRRGAQMAIMRSDHPDIGRFAVAKRTEGEYDNFNISVGVTDEFKEAVENDETYTLYSPESDFEDAFELVEDTAHFYSPQYADMPETVVDENVWRDHADEIQAWDWDEGKTVSFREKWEDYFERAAVNGQFKEGSKMELPARFIWDLMLDGAWENGEPGLFYYDETNRKHSFDVSEHPDYRIEATNPCAEQPLSEFEACNLGHVNLSLMLRDGAPTFEEWTASTDYEYDTTKAAVYDYFEAAMDFEQFDETIETGTRFLDNVVTMSEFPLDEITERVNDLRKIGLGVMGWAQLLYQMGIRYGSDESLQMARVVMGYIDEKATKYSHELAGERGPFPAWDKSKYADPTEYPEWFQSHAYELPSQHEDGYKMRNHNVTTVAPTGTTSMLGDTSGGIEPVYNVAYKKNVGNDIQGDDKLVEFDKVFLAALESTAGVDLEAVKEQAAEQMDSDSFEGVQSLDVPAEMKEIFVTTNDLTAREHGLMQRAFQEAVDSGISKTVNLPNDATHDDVHDAYMLALADDELGAPIKGLTVYRDGSREEQVLMTSEFTDKELETAQEKLEQAGHAVLTEDELPEGADTKDWLDSQLEEYKKAYSGEPAE
jgi:ribonucleoside-diphosphate reductase alpha chain